MLFFSLTIGEPTTRPQSLQKLVSPTNPFYENLAQAYLRVKEIAIGINEAKRRYESINKVIQLQNQMPEDFPVLSLSLSPNSLSLSLLNSLSLSLDQAVADE